MTSQNGVWKHKAPYHADFAMHFSDDPIYKAQCHCGRVVYEVQGKPLDSKQVVCEDSRDLPPTEWVSVFEKDNVRFDPSSLDFLHFYSFKLDKGWTSEEAEQREAPVRVTCSTCRTPVADEGRKLFLAFTTLFRFDKEEIPNFFHQSGHLFDGKRVAQQERLSKPKGPRRSDQK